MPQPVIDLTIEEMEAERPLQDASARTAGTNTDTNSIPSSRATRLPRFTRQIIDISDDEVMPQQQQHLSEEERQQQDIPNFPDVQFVSSRRLSRQRSPRRRSGRQNLEGDELEILHDISSAPLSSMNRDRRRESRDRYGPRGLAVFIQHHLHGNSMGRLAASDNNGRNGGDGGRGGSGNTGRRYVGSDPLMRDRIPLNFTLPDLDFTMVPFPLSTSDNDYQAPPPAPEGFTMTPAEEEVLTCPNCEDELCTGDKPQKRQVWVLKTCGHVSEFVLYL